MKVCIACLEGQADEINHAKVIQTFRGINVTKPADIYAAIGKIYNHPQSPFPFIGTVRATREGFIIPTVSSYFMWIFLDQSNGHVILDDFGAGNHRMFSFYTTCLYAMKYKRSIWDYADQWSMSHHKTNLETLVAGYVNFVSSSGPVENYAAWIGGKQILAAPSFDPLKELHYYVGIDLTAIDNTRSVRALLENNVYKIFIKKHNLLEEKRARRFVSFFMRNHNIHANAVVGEVNGLSPNLLEQNSKELISACQKHFYSDSESMKIRK